MLKFGQPCEKYHNKNRTFVSWKKEFSNKWYQGEVDKATGQPDGKGIKLEMDSVSIG